MLTHILVAVDGSVSSRHAARYALSLAVQTKAKVTLLTVLPPAEVFPLGPLSGYVPMRLPRSDEEVAKIKALFAEISAEHSGVEVAHAVELGPVSETICTWAKHNEADLIILGARGLGVARSLLLGSISQQVVQHASCPVLIWRPRSEG